MSEPYLGAADLGRIKGFRPAYERAVKVTGWLPWEALVPIHYRENSLLERSKTIGGAFQLDPGGVGDELKAAIETYVDHVSGLYGIALGDIEDNFETAAIVAAHELKTKLKGSILAPDGSINEGSLAWGYMRYNGLGAKIENPDGSFYRFYSELGQTGAGDPATSPDWSPYVSNDPLGGRVLVMRATQPDPADPSKRIIIRRPDPRPGAMVIFRELLARSPELA